MSFGKIQLPDFLLADLYRNNLVFYDDGIKLKEEPAAEEKNTSVIIETPATAPIIEPAIVKQNMAGKKWFLGDNNKGIAIVVKDEEAVFLRDEWLQFLSTILGACKLNIGDVAIINYANYTCDYNDLTEALSPQYFLLFGVTAQDIQLPFTVPNYQVQKFGNTSFLLAPSLALMQGTAEAVKMEKSKLWLSLKKMFAI